MTGNGRLTLYLVRHASADHADASKWPDDSKRPLTQNGIQKFRDAAKGLRRLVPEVEVVLSSGYARAWETAELLHEVAGWPQPQESSALEAGRPPTPAIDALREHEEKSIALVGHEPHLSTLASILCGGGENFHLKLRKGGVAVVRVDGDPAPGSGYLLWAVGPKILRALDGPA
jgi:phosphohistidine phosphatase